MFNQKIRKNCGYTLTDPKSWSKEEEQFILDKREKGIPLKQIALLCNRSEVSVSIKLKRLGKKNKTYNKLHIEEKYTLNKAFLEIMNPYSILDLYAGEKSFYFGKINKLTTNDSNITYTSLDYNEKAEKLIHKLYYEGQKYDIIDLDPFGSAYECFDLAIKMAKKGLIITFGELGHKRFKRLDYVKRYYGIDTLEDFSLDNILKELQKIALRNKKKLIVLCKGEWNRISRVYFLVKDVKITEQWD